MTKSLGDYAPSTVIYSKFTTYRPSTGAAYTLGGTPALSVYKDNSTTQSTSGVTLTVDFDSVTGLNHFAIDTSADGTFYSSGSNFDVVITTGTVDSVSVVGTVVASFSIDKTSSLKPTTAGRKLDVTATGEAGIDWANIGSPTTTVNLSGTTVKTATDVETDTADIQSRLPAALVSGRIDASVGAMAANTLTSSALATDAVTEIQSGLSTLSAADVSGAVWNAATASYGTAGTYGALVETNLDATVSSRLATSGYTAPDNASITSILADTNELQTDWVNGGRLDLLIDAIKAKTDSLTFTVAGQVDANVQYVNDVQVNGTGAPGNEWGP